MSKDNEDNPGELYHESGNVRDLVPHSSHDMIDPDDLYMQIKEKVRLLSERDILLMAKRAMYENLLIALEMGSATHQEMTILSKLLKDNGLTFGEEMNARVIDGEVIHEPVTKKEPKAPLPEFKDPEYLDED